MSEKRATKTKKLIPPNRIRELREARGWEAKDLARMIGTTPATVSRLESLQQRVTGDRRAALAKAFQVNPEDIIKVSFDKKFMAQSDEALLGSALNWLMEGAEASGLTLSSEQLSHWAGYVYKVAVEEKLNYRQTKLVAYTITLALSESR